MIREEESARADKTMASKSEFDERVVEKYVKHIATEEEVEEQ